MSIGRFFTRHLVGVASSHFKSVTTRRDIGSFHVPISGPSFIICSKNPFPHLSELHLVDLLGHGELLLSPLVHIAHTLGSLAQPILPLRVQVGALEVGHEVLLIQPALGLGGRGLLALGRRQLIPKVAAREGKVQHISRTPPGSAPAGAAAARGAAGGRGEGRGGRDAADGRAVVALQSEEVLFAGQGVPLPACVPVGVLLQEEAGVVGRRQWRARVRIEAFLYHTRHGQQPDFQQLSAGRKVRQRET